tara:strand:+ start:300 stop:890 length:591 start_codon:yes stop_codon:yes gene_type:complete
MYSKKKKFKIILVGSSNVGKTSIMNTFDKNKINKFPSATIGTEFTQIQSTKYNHTLHVWDCAGQEKYRAVSRIYYRDIQGCVFIFDLSDIKSLYDLKNYWIKEVQNNNTINPVSILVGNKSDLSINTDYDLIDELVKNYQMKYIETSVVQKKNINQIFDSISDYLSTDTIPEYEHTDIFDYKVNNNNYFNNMYGYC